MAQAVRRVAPPRLGGLRQAAAGRPGGFKRILHYGLIGPAHKAANLAAARAALEAPTPAPALVESVEAFMRRVANIEWLNCPHCREGRFVLLEAIPPSPLPRPPPQGPP